MADSILVSEDLKGSTATAVLPLLCDRPWKKKSPNRRLQISVATIRFAQTVLNCVTARTAPTPSRRRREITFPDPAATIWSAFPYILAPVLDVLERGRYLERKSGCCWRRHGPGARHRKKPSQCDESENSPRDCSTHVHPPWSKVTL